MKTEMTRSRCTPRRRTTTLPASRRAVHQVAPPRREVTTTTLLPGPVLGLPPEQILGFPPVHNGVGKRYPTPFSKDGDTHRRHHVSVEMTEVSLDPKKHTPDAPSCSTKLANHHHMPPRS